MDRITQEALSSTGIEICGEARGNEGGRAIQDEPQNGPQVEAAV